MPSSPRKKTSNKPKSGEGSPVKKKRNPNLIPRDDVPSEAKGTQRAFQIHICVAMGILNSAQAPVTAPAVLKKRFAERYPSQEHFSELVRTIKQRKYYHDHAATGNSLSKDVANVEDLTLRTLFSLLDRYQFDQFCPDLADSPDSDYNSAMRTFAIDSFTQACRIGGYSRFGIHPMVAGDLGMLEMIYDSYVFHTIKNKSRKEARDPGAAQRQAEDNATGQRRRELAQQRDEYLKRIGCKSRVRKAFSGSYCVSEDELAVDERGFPRLLNGQPYYHIRQVPGRNPVVTDLARRIDTAIQKGGLGATVEPAFSNKKASRSKFSKRVRIVPEEPILPPKPYIPSEVPLDYFTPVFFNGLAKAERTNYSHLPYLAFPPERDADWLFKHFEEWATIDNKE
ncbi:hypothetical protein VKT23_015528 [Stygiomarasmius scandens]|uniref:Uncharacterized protein n=1 Tax=Marasmiellus scandens TaxID=2682957 RepID=A0ABR1IXE0_9AGAR